MWKEKIQEGKMNSTLRNKREKRERGRETVRKKNAMRKELWRERERENVSQIAIAKREKVGTVRKRKREKKSDCYSKEREGGHSEKV